MVQFLTTINIYSLNFQIQWSTWVRLVYLLSFLGYHITTWWQQTRYQITWIMTIIKWSIVKRKTKISHRLMWFINVWWCFKLENHLFQRKASRFLTEVQLPFYFQRHGMYCKHYTVAACSGWLCPRLTVCRAEMQWLVWQYLHSREIT